MNKAALKAVLGRSDWFAQLDSEFADDILELGRIRRLNDSLIYSASDVADGIFALISGQVRMTRVLRSGQLAYLIIASPGAWFGVSAAVDGKPYGYDASAIGSAVLFHLGRERMNQARSMRVMLRPLGPRQRGGDASFIFLNLRLVASHRVRMPSATYRPLRNKRRPYG
jgi:CRP-like cAMP-binding protein